MGMNNKLSDMSPKDSKLNGFYRGIVEDRNDPEKLGRVRVRVFGVHTDVKIQTPTEGIPTDHLPWAEAVTSSIEGGINGFGLWSVPLQGSQVLIFFEEGNMMKPRYMASLPGIPEESSKGKSNIGFFDPDEYYPIASKVPPHEPTQAGENDINKLALNESISDTIVKSKTDKKDKSIEKADNNTWDEPDPYYAAEYPDNIVLATHSGITIELDNTKGSERLHVYHPSNTYIEISKDGDMVIRNAKDKFEVVDNNKKVHIMGNHDDTIDKNKTHYVKMDQTEKIGINKKEVVGLNKDVRVHAEEVKRVTQNYNLNAKIIRLNCTQSEPNVPNL